MKLKYKLPSKDAIPNDLAHLYVERDGAFVLNVDGAVDQTAFDKTRTDNLSLLQQLDETKRRFEGIDPEAVRALEAEKQKLLEQQAVKAGEFEKVIESRLKLLKTNHDKEVSSLAAERDTLVARLSEIQIDQGVVAAATKRGLRPSAIPDITARARQTFKLIDGVPTAVERDGKTPRAAKDGTGLKLEDWIDDLVSEAPHLFESNAGAGSAGSFGRVTTGVQEKNPFRRESWNLTEQMRLQKSNPELANKLRSQATH